MKKLIVVLLFVFTTSFINGQSPISKGTFTIGGDVSFSSQSFDNVSNNMTVLTINPKVGFFFFDNIYSAISIDYKHQSMGYFSYNLLGVGPEVRYYFDLERVKPFAGLGFTYYEQTSGDSNNYKTTTSVFTLSGGVNFFLTNYFALETSINYSFINYNNPSGLYINNSDQSKLFQIAIGVNYFIN
jgi:opacity protein-like surface antigen